MDTKITLSFEKKVIEKAKEFAANQGISLSRLTEYLYEKITATPNSYKTLDDIPLAGFINLLAEEESVYKTTSKSKKSQKKEYYESKKS